jgi:hypothetical protein
LGSVGPQGQSNRSKGTDMNLLRVAVALAVALCVAAIPAQAQEQPAANAVELRSLQQEIEDLKQRLSDYDQLRARLNDLEKKAEAAEKKQPQPVQPANKDTKVKIDGRLFAGAFKTGEQGSFPNRSLDIPDAKLRLTVSPSQDVTIVNRFSNNRAASNGFDYFYVDLNNWGGALPGHLLRVGKFKIDVGQETWTDNPIESILISNSVSHISGYDEGINLRGPLRRGPLPPTYSVALMNGSKGVNPSDTGLAWSAKVGVPVAPRMYFSASYYHVGDLAKPGGVTDQADFNVAEVLDAPSGAAGWKRSLWELDARYGYGTDGQKSVVGAPADVPWQAGATYGQFEDDAIGVPGRKGSYWFVEGLYNLTPKTYLASRYSEVSLDGTTVAKLGGSPVAVNDYQRLSLGAGYRLTPMTHIKVEYSHNNAFGGATKPDLNQIAAGIATKF